MKWKCAVCGKELKNFGMEEYMFAPKLRCLVNLRLEIWTETFKL